MYRFWATWRTARRARGVRVLGDLAYIADAEGGLQIVDVSNPTAPSLHGSYDAPGKTWSVFADGHYAYVAD